MFFDYLRLAVINLTHRKLRSILTMIGIFIGIAAVVALISLGQGLQNAITAQFQQLGTNKIIIMSSAGSITSPVAGSIVAHPLTKHDLDVVRRTRGVDNAGGVLVKSGEVKSKDEGKNTFIYGYPLDESKKLFEENIGLSLKEGRKIKAGDRYGVLVGRYIADGFFKHKVRVGESIEILGKSFEIVGIMNSQGNRMDDSAIYLNIETVRELFNDPEIISMIIVQVQLGSKPSEVAERIEKKMRTDRNLEKGQEDFAVQTTEQLLSSFNTIFSIVQALIIGIAAISLLVGGIGIMNTMYTSVLERTKEIGIMKAIGARNRDILFIFLIESGLLGLVGGAIGAGIGVGIGMAVSYGAEKALGSSLLVAAFPPELIIGALAFSFLIGTLSGVLPARQAAKLRPVEALRYE
ncbi:ABC transporter permease [Candidatus Micrarchaeota archaeon]|nr:ABC transporter permease [Candidatus Micrarchaeota archaeon]